MSNTLFLTKRFTVHSFGAKSQSQQGSSLVFHTTLVRLVSSPSSWAPNLPACLLLFLLVSSELAIVLTCQVSGVKCLDLISKVQTSKAS